MADAGVAFLLDNLKQLLRYHSDLISNVKPELEKLQKDLSMFQAFLNVNTTKKRRKDDRMRELIRQIRDVVYEAGDVIDTFVTLAAEPKADVIDYFKSRLKKPLKLHSIAKNVEAVRSKVQEIYGDKNRIDFALINVADPVPVEENEAPVVRQENIVGFEDEKKKLIGYLKEETDELDVISIIGMPGLGKTTLAGMVFRHPDIQYEFPTRIWVYISQEFKRKNVLLAILKELNSVTDDMVNKTDSELAELVAKDLKKGKFLIVMDDVWTAEDWNELRATLPMSNSMGKLLITSRQMEVGNSANPNRPAHELRFLTQEESWELLQLEVFHKRESPPELEEYGKSILKKCDGLPLAIVVIGGILSKRVSATADVSAMRSMWKKVSENVNIHIDTEDTTKRMEKIIALSYDKLPYYLRACFLYLGMFPEDFEIPTWRLTRMWIAEGFIQQKGNISLEESAENHLDDLINRNLLRVDRRRRNGKVKTCRIHDMIRDFCITEAGNERENFLQEIKKSRERPFDPPLADIETFRRICIHSNLVNFLSSKLYGPSVRSFVCFSEEKIDLPVDINSVIPASFKLLRVLEVQPIKFSKIPKAIHHLIHLRFISISMNLDILPPIFSKLWNIQTLIVNTEKRTLDIRADIWKMKQLRHFKTNASATLPETGKCSVQETCEKNIKTLGTISPQSCTEGVFDRASYVKKLGIRGRLAMLLEAKKETFDNMVKLDRLEKLKLINDVFPDSTSNNPLGSLPPAKLFPPSLTRLTLADTFLKWREMSVLGRLENLEVLKLMENAFVGETWEAIDDDFSKLEVLYISRTDLVNWIASRHHFPSLRSLELWYCDKLSQIPEELAMIPSFQMLNINSCKCAAAAASMEKFRDKEEMHKGQTTKFKLSILPPLDK